MIMKNAILLRLSLVLMLGIGMMLSRSASAQSTMAVNFQVFYNELSPYGDWVIDPTYGNIWIPWAEPGFHPYVSNGYWTMTNFGNTWVSNYPWGWAPFHYGRWFWSDFYGWAWVPGYEWGPAWVSWRSGGGFYGWAPLAPGLHISVNVNLPRNYWVFIPQRRFRHRHMHRYFAPQHQVVNIYNRTTVINNTYIVNNRTFVAGPERREIERVTNTRVPVYQVSNAGNPGRAVVRNNSVQMYRPEISSNNEAVRPSRAISADEYGQRSRNQQRGQLGNENGFSNNPNNSRAQQMPDRTQTSAPTRPSQRPEVQLGQNQSSQTPSRSQNMQRSIDSNRNDQNGQMRVNTNGYQRGSHADVRSSAPDQNRVAQPKNVQQRSVGTRNPEPYRQRSTNMGNTTNGRESQNTRVYAPAPSRTSSVGNQKTDNASRNSGSTQRSNRQSNSREVGGRGNRNNQ